MRVSVCEHQKRSQHLHLLFHYQEKKSMAATTPLHQSTNHLLFNIYNTFKTSDIYLFTNNQTLTSDNID